MIDLLSTIKKGLHQKVTDLGDKIADNGCSSFEVYKELVGRRKGLIEAIASIDEQLKKYQEEDESETD